ncbi:hypothetical protein [Curtobacterium citreum]|uniref:hypothetical protein n=1 Tax=Curtobacterium citreum TaxID=2036 RepID=UPI000B048726|nr:hypothetical protein [Curtobacterium citreum]
MGIGVAGLVGALTGAVIAAIGIVVTVVEGRRTRRNAEFSVHRDLWWQRWSWVADRALSADVTERERAALMAQALMTPAEPAGRPGRSRARRRRSDTRMITDEPDWRFKQRLGMLEMAWPRLLADPHYGPLMHSTGRVHLLDEFRQEWREREERARARRLRWEASVGEG